MEFFTRHFDVSAVKNYFSIPKAEYLKYEPRKV